ncbi:hypothetical protein [Actinomadura sp. BRA 177]|uniref:hypothetical protein n=1 Tax=Actinomadura sp. BRA 177 TaxID=2745202 RepID=UPI002815CEB3|nr:hypothetical protein [Actinomadura sp. BRA 177]
MCRSSAAPSRRSSPTWSSAAPPPRPARRTSAAAATRGERVRRADVVVLDPPRTGAGRDVVEHITRLAGRKIAYVSCDPATLARDLAYFNERGWTLETLRAFDAFPMTSHVECLATLVRG